MHEVTQTTLFATRVGALTVELFELRNPEIDITAYTARVAHDAYGDMMTSTFPTYEDGLEYVTAWLDAQTQKVKETV